MEWTNRRLGHGGPVSARALRRCVDPLRLRASRIVAGAPGPVRIAGVPYPVGAQARHTLVCGADSAGRYALLADLVAQLRARRQRCVILDGTGRYTEAFFDAGRDVLLNPLDERAPAWSPLLEAREARDFVAMAAALLPQQADPLQRIRAEAAVRVFARRALKLWRGGVRSNRALANHLLDTDVQQELRALQWPELDAADPDNALAVGAQLWDMASTLGLLPVGGRPFVIRDWVLADRESDGGCLFLNSHGTWGGSMRALMAAWLEVAFDALHGRGRGDTARVWVILDDITAVNAVPGLKAALAGSPPFGGCVVLGVPVFAALHQVYGTTHAAKIADLCATRVMFWAGGTTETTRFAERLGRSDMGPSADAWTDGAGAHGGAGAITLQGYPRLNVSPIEIQCLKEREGYLKFPGSWPAARFRIRDGKRHRAAPRFVPRLPAYRGGPGDPPGGGNGRLNGGATGHFNWV
ncbi:MAG: type IV secretion system DNA-binding domain-containing protein [Rhodospirillaceae bacterium]|nr:type IV secretion system DNA-binding domain-containing protein [Rhodospirillaceae bacterium]